MQWLEPWWSVDKMPAEARDGYVRQLKRELSSMHPMYEMQTRLIGKKNDNDDALFEILDGTGRVAVVHLTWATQEVKYPWPSTTFFSSLDEFVEKRMKEDHADWIFPEQA
jgi:hypothetical protein